MGILRKLREWRENEDGTLEGPSLKTGEVDGEVNAQTESITELRDVYIIDAGTFDPADFPDDALVAEREE